MSGGLPLAGCRLLVTRRGEQSATLVARLAALGADVVQVPAIAIELPDDLAPLDEALGQLDRYDWLVFTSANAVRAVAERLHTLGLAWPEQLPRVAAVGPATTLAITDRLGSRGVDLMPTAEYRARGLLAAFAEAGGTRGQRLLLPQGDRARDTLARGLQHQGAELDVVVAYRTVVPRDLAARVNAALETRIDLALFASPSAVEGFVSVAKHPPTGLAVAVMGPITEKAARDAGLNVCAVAEPSTLEGLVAAAVRSLAARDER